MKEIPEGVRQLHHLRVLRLGVTKRAFVWDTSRRSRINDLGVIAELQQLTQLDCCRTDIVDLTPLTTLASLQVLDCSWTKVAELAPLGELANLCILNSRGRKSPILRP